jgi:hypothetical protein
MNQIIIFLIFIVIIFFIHVFLISKFEHSKNSEHFKNSEHSENSENFEHSEHSDSYNSPSDILSNYQIPTLVPTYTAPLHNLQPLIALQHFNIPTEILPLLNVFDRSNIIFELDLQTNKIPLTDNTGNYTLTPYCSTIITLPAPYSVNVTTGNNVAPSDSKYGVTIFNDSMFGYVLDIDNFANTTSCLLTNFSPGQLGITTYTMMYWLWVPNIDAINNNGSTISSNQWSMYFIGPWLEFNSSTGQRIVNQTIPFISGTWAHVCITFDGTTTIYYINATKGDSSTVKYTFDNSPVAIAGSWDGTNVRLNGNKLMKRRFAHIKFLNIGLTQSQVSQIYFSELLNVNNLSSVIDSYNNLYSKYFNLYIQSQNTINRTSSIQNIINQYNQSNQDITNIIPNIANLYKQLSNTTYVTTQNTSSPSYVPYLTSGTTSQCGGFKLNACQLTSFCIYNGKGGWISNIPNVCSLTTPVTIDYDQQKLMVATNLSQVQLLDINGAIINIRNNIVNAQNNINTLNSSINTITNNINSSIPIDQNYIASQTTAIQNLITSATNNIQTILTKNPDTNSANLLNTILKNIQSINIVSNITNTDLFNISRFYENIINQLIRYLYDINNINDNLTINNLQNTIANYKPIYTPVPVPNQCQTSSNNICVSIKPINYTYINIGCYNGNPTSFLTNYYGNLTSTSENAYNVATKYGVTVYGLTSNNDLYFGFNYDKKMLSTTCNKNTMVVYAATIPSDSMPIKSDYHSHGLLDNLLIKSTESSKLPNSVYEYTIFGVVSGTKFTSVINSIFEINPQSLQNISNVGKVDSDEAARALGNKYGATAFYVNNDGNVFITYNFNIETVLQFSGNNTAAKSRTAFKNQLYYVRFRTKQIQLNNDLFCSYT